MGTRSFECLRQFTEIREIIDLVENLLRYNKYEMSTNTSPRLRQERKLLYQLLDKLKIKRMRVYQRFVQLKYHDLT